MPNPSAAMIVIGDEILSGRTRDSNMNHLAKALTDHGIDLAEARMIPDVPEVITDTVRELSARHTYVFTSGGIGPTHDDITADCVAAAFGVGINVREDARMILAQNYSGGEADLTPARLRMARIPDGATLIDNPVSRAPGFSISNVHVMAGVPRVFEAMVAGLLPSLEGGAKMLSHSYRVDAPESKIATPLGAFDADWPGVSVGSYPFTENGKFGARIVLRSTDAALLANAVEAFPAFCTANDLPCRTEP